MVGVDKRPTRSQDSSRIRGSPVIRHKKPQNLPVPSKLLDQTDTGHQQPGTEDGEQDSAEKSLFVRALRGRTKGVQEHEEKKRRIGQELEQITAGQRRGNGEWTPETRHRVESNERGPRWRVRGRRIIERHGSSLPHLCKGRQEDPRLRRGGVQIRPAAIKRLRRKLPVGHLLWPSGKAFGVEFIGRRRKETQQRGRQRKQLKEDKAEEEEERQQEPEAGGQYDAVTWRGGERGTVSMSVYVRVFRSPTSALLTPRRSSPSPSLSPLHYCSVLFPPLQYGYNTHSSGDSSMNSLRFACSRG